MSRKIQLKEGVSLMGIQYEMRKVLVAADKIWEEHGQVLVITEACGGEHSAGSLHYYGLALDLRTRFWENPEASQVANELKEALPEDYDVVNHPGSHIHVEYDPK